MKKQQMMMHLWNYLRKLKDFTAKLMMETKQVMDFAMLFGKL